MRDNQSLNRNTREVHAMKKIVLKDLTESQELDSAGMAGIIGGVAILTLPEGGKEIAGAGPVDPRPLWVSCHAKTPDWPGSGWSPLYC